MGLVDIPDKLRDRYLTWELQRKLGILTKAPGDILRWLTRRERRLIPPAYRSYAYGDHFTEIGQEFLRHFVELGGLTPGDRILDVGCGIGRMAAPLTGYLSGTGEYWGFDILADGIDWCNKNISPVFSNFHFELVDVYNRSYRPQGRQLASAYRFPYPDGFFDFVCACSVFTHMLPPDTQNYLAEISRVTKPGGTCLATFFILNQDSLALMSRGSGTFKFTDSGSGYYSVSRHEPEKAVAYEEGFVRQAYARCGLYVIEPIHYGSWCGRTDARSGQDIVVATRAGRA